MVMLNYASMKNKKIVIAGGSGFIGEELTKYFGKNNTIVILTRQLANASNNRANNNSLAGANLAQVQFVKWDGKTTGDWVKEIDGADYIINLTGKSVNCRYTKKNKKEILESRTNAAQAIGAAIRQCSNPPACWINAGSATIYRDAVDKPQDEYTGDIGEGFSVQVCREWEKAFYEQATPTTRKVALRMAITLGPGAVLVPYFNLLKFGLGGKQASGKQMYSWIHIEDTCRMMDWILEHAKTAGSYNCCSPNPITNKEFMKTLRKVTHTPFGLPAFTWMLKAGAWMIGTEAELVLKSRWVIPTKILETGFSFKYPFLEDALTDIISKVPRKQYHLF